jgi:hypothetical protein
VVIARQPAMTTEGVSTRPPPPRLATSPHELVFVEEPTRAWTLVKITGLIAITAVSVALCAAILAGGALFAILNFG